jgi:two-component system sensor histidine kinase AlgZ
MITAQFFRKRSLLFLHIIFWGLYFSFFFYSISFPRRGGMDSNYTRAFSDAITQVITMAAICYFNYFILLPKVLKSRRWGLYIMEVTASLAVIIAIQIFIKKQIYIEFNRHWSPFDYWRTGRFLIQHTLSTIFIVAFIATLRFLEDWFNFEAQRQEIENEKLQTELKFLKEQINPHFLFNTLNNLYYLAHTQSPNTKEVIAKLSQMMRYMIYEANAEKVPVANEIEYIKNYIDLEKLRLDEGFPIDLVIKGNYETLKITPFIFITFLENAFKHGVESGSRDSWVKVSITIDGTECTYTVANSKSPEYGIKEKKEGIGLKNTIRRLNLSYKNAHELRIEEDKTSYNVYLKINLDQ